MPRVPFWKLRAILMEIQSLSEQAHTYCETWTASLISSVLYYTSCTSQTRMYVITFPVLTSALELCLSLIEKRPCSYRTSNESSRQTRPRTNCLQKQHSNNGKSSNADACIRIYCLGTRILHVMSCFVEQHLWRISLVPKERPSLE